jgi:hypothetical protein
MLTENVIVPISSGNGMRTRGYCMPHKYLGYTFVERAGGGIELREVVTLKFALSEYLRTYSLREDLGDADSRARCDIFAAAFQPGDLIRAFVGGPSEKTWAFYATSGFALVRNGEIIEVVVTGTAANRPAVKGLAMMAGADEWSAERALREDCIPDCWGKPF